VVVGRVEKVKGGVLLLGRPPGRQKSCMDNDGYFV